MDRKSSISLQLAIPERERSCSRHRRAPGIHPVYCCYCSWLVASFPGDNCSMSCGSVCEVFTMVVLYNMCLSHRTSSFVIIINHLLLHPLRPTQVLFTCAAFLRGFAVGAVRCRHMSWHWRSPPVGYWPASLAATMAQLQRPHIYASPCRVSTE